MSANPIVSIVIPNFNGRHLLERTLAHNVSVLGNYPVEWIVSDDASTDDSVGWLESHFPNIVVTKNSVNSGFAVTAHRGAMIATSNTLFFLNNDMKISDLDLGTIIQKLKSPSLFAIVPTILRPSKNNALESITWGYFRGGWFTPESYLPDGVDQQSPRSVLWACGGAMLVTRERYMALGGFDPLFSPFYFEDLDLSYRAWQRGWESWYMPLGTILHDHQATIGRLFSETQVATIHRRNHYLFMWKNLSSPMVIISHLATVLIKIVTVQWADIKAIAAASFYLGKIIRYRMDRRRLMWDDNRILDQIWEVTSPY